jgi:hypothetical protein
MRLCTYTSAAITYLTTKHLIVGRVINVDASPAVTGATCQNGQLPVDTPEAATSAG